MRHFPLVLLAAGAVACGSQASPDYRGEPLASVSGAVVGSAPTPSIGALDAAILWVGREASPTGTGPDAYPPKLIAERVSVASTFPANFALDTFAPPPETAELGDTRTTDFVHYTVVPTGAWVGVFVALDHGSDDPIGGIRGIDRHHLLFYFDHDGTGRPANPTTEDDGDVVSGFSGVFHVPATKGFHLALLEPPSDAEEAASFRCETPTGLCVHTDGAATAYEQAAADARFANCLKVYRDSCTITSHPANDQEQADSAACEKREADAEAALPQPIASCPWPFKNLENSAGFSSPITIELGKSFWDLWL